MIFFLVGLIVIALYALLFVWVKANMNSFEKGKVIKWIVIGGVITLVISIILVIGNKIELQNKQIQNTMNIVNICILAPINALISLPYMASIRNRLKQKVITEEKAKRKWIIAIIIFVIILCIESGYVKSFQDILLAIQKNR